MKKWPEKSAVVRFTDITQPIMRAMRFAYTLKRKNRQRDIPWEGLDIGKEEQACCFSPIEKLTAFNLEYSLDSQGRDALTEIVGVAVQLGIEQGRRMAHQDMTSRIDILKLMHQGMHSPLEQLQRGMDR